MKTFRCRDAGQNCNAEFKAGDEQSLMEKVSEHARSAHHIELKSDPAQLNKVRGAIRDQ